MTDDTSDDISNTHTYASAIQDNNRELAEIKK